MPQPAIASLREDARMDAPARPHPLLGLVAWLALVFAAGAAGAIASANAPSFYAELARPAWAPPPGVFGPVWSVLYLLMGVSAWLVWKQPGPAVRRTALTFFIVQLALNAAWSWLFFAWRLGAWAFADVLLLLGLILATVLAFWPVHRLAALLMLPYLAWVAFASALTFTVWRANPALLG